VRYWTESLRLGYRSCGGQLWRQVVADLVRSSWRIDRATGYFSSGAFAGDPQAWLTFLELGGYLRLVCSNQWERLDIRAAHQGLYQPKTLESHLPQILQGRGSQRDIGRHILSWMIANRRMEIFIARPRRAKVSGIYHEKFGIYYAKTGETVVLSGSANETLSGNYRNFERLEAFHGGGGKRDANRVHNFQRQFQMLADKDTTHLEVFSLHEAFRLDLLVCLPEEDTDACQKPKAAMVDKPYGEVPPEILRPPSQLILRPHQDAAVRAWLANRGRGVFAMATGAGKTISALAAAKELYDRVGGPLVLVFVAPYLALLDQWEKEAEAWGLCPIRCSKSRQSWLPVAKSAIFLANKGERKLLSLLVTNTTFALSSFQSCLEKIRVRTLIVGDEMHNLGARNLRHALPDKVSLRLGLSATPTRWMDEDGTRAVNDYFGPIVSSFSLGDALAAQPPVLCEYDYHPVLVPLTQEEQDEYIELTSQLGRYINNPSAEDLSDLVLALLLRRSRLIASAQNKIPLLKEHMQAYQRMSNTLVYCGDGRVEIEDDSWNSARFGTFPDEERQIEAVTRILNHELGMNVRSYTADTSPEDRRRVLRDFQDGRINALVAIRCLDEGVDIPSISRAFILASSTNPRQFIQRRGRVLRRSPGKEHAEIFDFIVDPPHEARGLSSSARRVLRNLVAREMARVLEFCSTARNRHQARASLLALTRRFSLDHL
jgi:superfamily II DNA or RNA helicase